MRFNQTDVEVIDPADAQLSARHRKIHMSLAGTQYVTPIEVTETDVLHVKQFQYRDRTNYIDLSDFDE